MLKPPQKPTKSKTSKRVAVIKNGHTTAELAESGERWANHTGPYITLADVLAAEAAKQKQMTAGSLLLCEL